MIFLFDIDGTLLRSGGAGERALNRAFATLHGLPDAMRDVHPSGKTDPLIVGEIFANRLGRTPAPGEMVRVLDCYLEALAPEIASAPRFRLMPAVPEVLRVLAERGTLALATGNLEAGARMKLDRAGLTHFFRPGGSGEDRLLGGFGSDAAERIELTRIAAVNARAASDAAGARTLEVIVIGDTEHDVTAARAIGAVAVAVCTGVIPRKRLEEAGADAVLDDLTGFLAWMDAWRSSTNVDAAPAMAKMAAP